MTGLDDAIRLAVEAHAGQADKNGDPYILHPLRVMLSVPPECRVAAVLHDVVEDSATVGHGDILALFGADVHAAVYALTRQKDEPYAEFIERCSANLTARSVKIADLRDNLRPGAPHLRDKYEAALFKLLEQQP